MMRKRIEASVPLTRSEIQADKDRIRAEAAMAIRRLEISVKSLKETAAAQTVEINRGREELKTLVAERAEKNQAFSELEAKREELEAELARRQDQLRQLSGQLAEAERLLEERALELEKLGRMYDEAAFSSSNRQIELVAREAEIEKLAGDISTLREQRKEAMAENKTAQEALKIEKKRAGDLDRKVERLLATVADRDEKLERRDRELTRLRERLKGRTSAKNGTALNSLLAPGENNRLNGEQTGLAGDSAMEDGTNVEQKIARLNADRERLEARLTGMARENKELKAELSSQGSRPQDRTDERRESAVLREQIQDLAAEVVSLTAALEGPDSPIAKALAAPPRSMPGGEHMPSLADRVRALQKAASPD
jgi:chromosome segregation ATPase